MGSEKGWERRLPVTLLFCHPLGSGGGAGLWEMGHLVMKNLWILFSGISFNYHLLAATLLTKTCRR